MKKIIIKNLAGVQTHGAQMENPTEWIVNCIASNVWGLPEREEIDENGQPTGMILPAEYTIEIEDISFEHELSQVLAKRKSLYPSPEEFLNAFFDGGEQALEELRQQRLAVKAANPKPIKE